MESFKIKLIKNFIIIIIFYSFFKTEGHFVYAQKTYEKIPNIIIITLSGVRNEESIKDPTHQYIPNLWNKMFKEGVLYANLVNLNLQFHMPQVNAINTGKTHYFMYDKIYFPTIFQYIRKKYNLPADKLWLIGNWYLEQIGYAIDGYDPNTYPLSISTDFLTSQEFNKVFTKQELIFLDLYRNYLRENFFSSPQWSGRENISFCFLKKIMRKFKPKLIHYVMGAVECAHYDTFSQYVLSLKRCDEMIFEIWNFIKTDPFYKDNTYLIVCVDHERNLYYMNHNEDTFDNSSRVWMYIYGPDIKKGVVIKRKIKHVDIFSTVAYLMNIETSASEGEVLKDCFLHK